MAMEWNAFTRGNGRGIPSGRARRPEKVAFVLSGGGVLGAIQVGQLEALLEAGIVPDLVVCASVGALNGAAIAAEPTIEGAQRLRDVWLSLRTEDIFPGSRVQRALHFVRKGDHLYPNSGLRQLISIVPARTFEALQRPTHIVASGLRSGKEHWFESGPLAPAVLASAAIPGIFPPVLVDGELYVDGGMVNNVPVSRAIELGATQVYALTCGTQSADRQIRRPIDVLLQAVVGSRAARIETDLALYASKARIEMLPGPDVASIRYNDMSQTQRLVREARELTRDHLSNRRSAVGA